MRIAVNGDPVEVVDGASVADLLTDLGLDGRWVIVERNLEPVLRRSLDTTRLAEGDRIELVRAVAGG